jgi:hypothetical protein
MSLDFIKSFNYVARDHIVDAIAIPAELLKVTDYSDEFLRYVNNWLVPTECKLKYIHAGDREPLMFVTPMYCSMVKAGDRIVKFPYKMAILLDKETFNANYDSAEYLTGGDTGTHKLVRPTVVIEVSGPKRRILKSIERVFFDGYLMQDIRVFIRGDEDNDDPGMLAAEANPYAKVPEVYDLYGGASD